MNTEQKSKNIFTYTKIECLGQKKVFKKFWLTDCYQLTVLHQAAKPASNALNRSLDISLHKFKSQ